MKPIDRPSARLLAALCLFFLSAPPAGARQDPAVQAPAAFSAAEIRRLLDAYTVMQAQEFLGLTDAQFAQFLPRLKVLQDTRRRQQQARNKLVQELNRMSAPKAAQVPEGELRDRLRSLQELEIRSASERQSAYETLDQVLTVRQQARFRVFEEQMERRQLELLMRARAAGGALGRAQRPAARPR
jgi:hypothetical protein